MTRRLMAAGLACLWTAGMVPAAVPQQGTSSETEEWTIPEGTEFKLQLHSTVNSRTSKAGDRVLATLIDPVAVEDREVLPRGARVDGHIGEVKSAGRKGKGGYLYIVFDTVELPNAEKVSIVGSPSTPTVASSAPSLEKISVSEPTMATFSAFGNSTVSKTMYK